jgi:hypothetical protein
VLRLTEKLSVYTRQVLSVSIYVGKYYCATVCGSTGASAPGGVTGAAATAAVASGSSGDPQNPVYNTQKLVQSLDVLCINGFRWVKDVENVASSKKIKLCLEEEHPDTPGDALAKSLVTEKIPDEWVDAALDKLMIG